jgi:hypothetical protein
MDFPAREYARSFEFAPLVTHLGRAQQGARRERLRSPHLTKVTKEKSHLAVAFFFCNLAETVGFEPTIRV